jgi:hypothetical protein
VRLKFSIPEKQAVLRLPFYEEEPPARPVPASIEIKPLLDRPVAFQIALEKENERHLYDVDWSGKIAHLA